MFFESNGHYVPIVRSEATCPYTPRRTLGTTCPWKKIVSRARLTFLEEVQSTMNKFEASALRFRQRTLELKAARSRTVFIPDYTAPASVGLATAAAAKKKAAGPVAAKGPTCTARTLEGRQCTFRVVAGGCFCKKHSTMV
jgi:hypothetical protein